MIGNEPQPPVYCSQHGQDYVDLTNFGELRPRLLCVYCMDDKDASPADLYASKLAQYEERKREYDALTPRIEAIEREIRGCRQ